MLMSCRNTIQYCACSQTLFYSGLQVHDKIQDIGAGQWDFTHPITDSVQIYVYRSKLNTAVGSGIFSASIKIA